MNRYVIKYIKYTKNRFFPKPSSYFVFSSVFFPKSLDMCFSEQVEKGY